MPRARSGSGRTAAGEQRRLPLVALRGSNQCDLDDGVCSPRPNHGISIAAAAASARVLPDTAACRAWNCAATTYVARDMQSADLPLSYVHLDRVSTRTCQVADNVKQDCQVDRR